MTQTSGSGPQPHGSTTPAPGSAEHPHLPPRHSRRLWWALGGSLLFLIVVLVFILQNLTRASTSFFVAKWSIPLGVDLLFAAVLGSLITLLISAGHVLQLRHAARRLRQRERQPPGMPPRQ